MENIVLEVNSNLKLIGRIHISTFTPSSQLVLSIAADNVQAFPLALTMTDLIKGFTHFLKENKKKKNFFLTEKSIFWSPRLLSHALFQDWLRHVLIYVRNNYHTFMVRLKLLHSLLEKKKKCNLKSRYSYVSDAFCWDNLENSLFCFICF